MRDRPRIVRWMRLGVFAAVLIGTTGASAQGPFGGMSGMSGLSPPRFEPDGLWARVVSVTPKWLVLENEAGQQFPVAADAVDLFLMRWPITPSQLTPGSWIEVTGIDLNSSQVLCDHADVFEGAARALVSPTSQYLVGYNRVMTLSNPFQMGTFGQTNLLPGEELLPRRRHLVAPVISGVPLVLAAPGNESVGVVGAAGGMSMTSVTPGLPRPGPRRRPRLVPAGRGHPPEPRRRATGRLQVDAGRSVRPLIAGMKTPHVGWVRAARPTSRGRESRWVALRGPYAIDDAFSHTFSVNPPLCIRRGPELR